MKLDLLVLWSTLVAQSAASAFAAPAADVAPFQPVQHAQRDDAHYEELWKRRGGGGGGGRGGGGGGGRSGGGSSGRGSSGGRGSSTSTAGGRTTTGSGPKPAFGNGRFYGGGAQVPYKSGGRSPSGIAPVAAGLLAGAALTLAFWPGTWHHGAYLYPYTQPYRFFNETTNVNETKPVTCGCDPYMVCGCDENRETGYLDELIGNGDYAALNKTLVNVATVDGKSTILINGTLPNGTTAAGGTENPNAGAGLQALLQSAGYWPMVATVGALVFLN